MRKINRKFKKGSLFVLTFFILFFSFISCGEREVYFRYAQLKDAQWFQSDTLQFCVDSTDIEPNTPYDISLEITNNAGYDYRNIWLFIKDDMLLNTDSASFSNKSYMLADESGKWYGDGLGALHQISLPYLESVTFPRKENYKISIVQGMRDEPLVGIERIGVRVAKSTTN